MKEGEVTAAIFEYQFCQNRYLSHAVWLGICSMKVSSGNTFIVIFRSFETGKLDKKPEDCLEKK